MCNQPYMIRLDLSKTLVCYHQVCTALYWASLLRISITQRCNALILLFNAKLLQVLLLSACYCNLTVHTAILYNVCLLTLCTAQQQQHGDNYSKSSYKPVSSVSSGLGGGGFTIFTDDNNDDAINSSDYSR
jgi:hypothetical protein